MNQRRFVGGPGSRQPPRGTLGLGGSGSRAASPRSGGYGVALRNNGSRGVHTRPSGPTFQSRPGQRIAPVQNMRKSDPLSGIKPVHIQGAISSSARNIRPQQSSQYTSTPTRQSIQKSVTPMKQNTINPSTTLGKRSFGHLSTQKNMQPAKKQRPIIGTGPAKLDNIQLRNELTNKVQKLHPDEMAVLACVAVTAATRPLTDRMPTQYIESTFDEITHHLGLQTELLHMFKQRVSSRLHKELATFMQETYQTELVQLLKASSIGHSIPQDQLLKKKVLAIIREGELSTLDALQKQWVKNEHLKNQAQIMNRNVNPLNQLTQRSNMNSQGNPSPHFVQKQQQPQVQHRLQPHSSSQSQSAIASPQPQPSPSQPTQKKSQVPVPITQKPDPKKEQLLANAALSGDLNTVKRLLAEGVNINAAHQGGWTALMNATLQGHATVVSTLISYKANLNVKDNGGFTALMYAASYLRVGIAEALVLAGADVKAADNAGRNIAHYAQDMQIKAAIDRGLAGCGLPSLDQLMQQKTNPTASAVKQTMPAQSIPNSNQVQSQQPQLMGQTNGQIPVAGQQAQMLR